MMKQDINFGSTLKILRKVIFEKTDEISLSYNKIVDDVQIVRNQTM